MKYLYSYKIFEARVEDLISSEEYNRMDNLNGDRPAFVVIKSIFENIKISDKLNKKNKFKIYYNNIIDFKYYDTPGHPLFGDDRLLSRTIFRHKNEFIVFCQKVFSKLYPTYFFETNDHITDIDNEDNSLIDFKKIYAVSVFDEGNKKDFVIPYKLSRKYNSITKEYDFYIYVTSIVNNVDKNKTYQVFYFNYKDNTPTFKYNYILGNSPHIPTYKQNYIKKLNDIEKELVFKDNELRKIENNKYKERASNKGIVSNKIPNMKKK